MAGASILAKRAMPSPWREPPTSISSHMIGRIPASKPLVKQLDCQRGRWATPKLDTRISAPASVCCRTTLVSTNRLKMAAFSIIPLCSKPSNMLKRTSHACTSAACSAMEEYMLTSRTWRPSCAWHRYTKSNMSTSTPSPMAAIPLPRVATVSGRYYAMDRDNRWDRTGMAYFAMTRAEGRRANSAAAAIQQSYDEGVTDEFIVPTVIMDDDHPVAIVKAGDALIHYNFRPDRARQLTKAFVMKELPPQAAGKFNRGPRIDNLQYIMMTEYEEGLDAEVAYRADEVDMPLARVISEHGLRQFHSAETEKYAHVTYFINGRREIPFPGEDRLLVPSPKVPTYDLQPEMYAAGVTDTAVEYIRGGQYDLIIMNYANADMVGHTGVIEAAIRGVEAVDMGVGRVVEATLAVGGGLLITADHGNAEQLIEYDTGKPFTAHTTYPVPLYLVVPQFAHLQLRTDGILADVAPTILQVMGIPQPKDMTGRSLIVNAS